MSADGQLLDEDFTKCSELHDLTGSSHYPRNVFDLEPLCDVLDENHVHKFLAFALRKASRIQVQVGNRSCGGLDVSPYLGS